tara:strand:- start:1394 stop:2647 length:1254 start_codon:yes stop_codon:yes gene_type:complete
MSAETQATLGLFEAVGIEIESMVVDAETLDVRPIVDELLRAAAGTTEWVGDVDEGAIELSNEFVAHVVEFKTNGPAPSWSGLEQAFRESAVRQNALLAAFGARLLPTAMHPWMDPRKDTQFWPHDNGPIYRAYHSLFDARRHGWSNLQSVHLNLPFRGEEQFARLMAAIRIVLPLVPALAASSPVVEGAVTGILDNRLEHYRTNSERVAAMTGVVIPEPVFGFDAYQAEVLDPIDVELRARGASDVLIGNEWTNARGAIARFDRMAIEIRLIDAQECAAADLAVAAAVAGIVRSLVEEASLSHIDQLAFPTEPLARLLVRTIAEGPAASLDDVPEFARAFGLEPGRTRTVGALLQAIVPRTCSEAPELDSALATILDHGVLSERILRALAGDVRREKLREVYSELANCQQEGRSFQP